MEALDLAAAVLQPVALEIGAAYRGAVVAGSRIYGKPSASSDLDIVVVTEAPWRQRRELFHSGVPIDLSILPTAELRRSYSQVRNPGMLEIMARGVILDDRNGVVIRLASEAKQRFAAGPPLLTSDERFSVCVRLRNIYLDVANDLLDRASRVLLTDAFVTLLLEFGYRKVQRWRPSAKQLLSAYPDDAFRAMAQELLTADACLGLEAHSELLRRCADRLGVAHCLQLEWEASTGHELLGSIRFSPRHR